MKILLTGSAGFIGNALALALLERGDEVVGLDNLNDYYDVGLKQARLERLLDHRAYTDVRMDIADADAISTAFERYQPQRVVNLAAQAGVRYSMSNPQAYVNSNLLGFANILDACRHHAVDHLVYASSSSVYGANAKLPFSVHDPVDHPLSLYAATKKSNEMMAHCYSHLFGLPATGLRFFTVYGPWGRPDMALFIFTRKILAGEPIEVFNHGRHKRDFTYIDDIVRGVVKVLDKPATPNNDWLAELPDPASSLAPHRIYNIGNHSSVQLADYIALIEQYLGKTAQKRMLPMQGGDMPDTFADIDDLVRDFDYRPSTTVEVGIRNFIDWYLSFYSDRETVT